MQQRQQSFVWPDGQPFDESHCLFAPPPTQIGAVRMASSSLPKNRLWTKALSGLGFRFRHTLGYLGEAGVACFECDRDPGRLVRREVLAFSEAANLFSHSTPSSFEFLWKDPLDRLLFRYEDTTPNKLDRDHILHLLYAAEEAWTEAFLKTAIANVERGGNVEFPVLGKGTLRLGHSTIGWGTMELHREDLEFFHRDQSRIEIHASYKGQSRGFESFEAATSTIGNLEALHHLLVHALNLPHRD